jgi:hypothetical protein
MKKERKERDFGDRMMDDRDVKVIMHGFVSVVL